MKTLRLGAAWFGAAFALAACSPQPAHGQGAVQQSGQVTVGHGAAWFANGVIGDGGAATAVTPGGSNLQVQYNNNSAFGGFTLGGDCTLTATTGVILCTKTNGTAFGAAATKNLGAGLDTSGSNIVLANPAESVLGGVKAIAPVAHVFLTNITTLGQPVGAQPAFTDISGQETLAQLPSIANLTVLGNVVGIAAVPTALSATQLTTLCNAFTSSLSGCASASGGGTTNFLRADGSWANPLSGTSTFGAVVASSLTSSAATFPLTGLTASTGGAVNILGGESTGGSIAGGLVTVKGGLSDSGVGGGLSLRGGDALGNAAGGAAVLIGGSAAGVATGGQVSVIGGNGAPGVTGNGGALILIGGFSNATNGSGGAASFTGGPATGNGTPGTVTITGGAADTSATGATVTIRGSAGAGGTNGGGGVNLVGGAAVSTGTPGEVQINGDGSLSFATYYFTGTPAATNQVFFVAPRPLRVKAISCVFSTAAGGTSTLDVTKDTSTNAPAAGTSVNSASCNLNATANTVQALGVSATVTTVNMATGDRLAVKFNHAIQASVGVAVTVGMQPY